MQDHSHSQLILYMAAGLVMGAVVVSGLDGSPSGLAMAGVLPASVEQGQTIDLQAKYGDFRPESSAGREPGSSLLPNAASCPGVSASSLITPPALGPADPTTAVPPLGSRAPSAATLGTGSACPASAADTTVLPYSARLHGDPATKNPAPGVVGPLALH
jgi:hypothetical protein